MADRAGSVEDLEPAGRQVPVEVYRRLAAATPRERTELVLRLIEEHPHGRLELPAREGVKAVLDGLDLSPRALAGQLEAAGDAPPWWDPSRQRVRLEGADLRGASLRQADLHSAVLRGADLRGVMLGKADLTGAVLEQADLRKADLAGARLPGAALGEANLAGAMLEEADLAGANLRFAELREAVLEGANLQAADLWGARLEAATLSAADLRRANLKEADLRRADLDGANLEGADLGQANLEGATLRGVDLREATLVGTKLRDARLGHARLQGVSLVRSDIAHIHLCGAKLDETEFLKRQLGGPIGEELTGAFEEAAQAYLALERNFLALGDPDAASWAYRRRRRMQKLEARRQLRLALAEHRWKDAAAHGFKYVSDEFVEWLCDYGESIPRVLKALFVVYLVFTLIYGITGTVVIEQETDTGSVKVTTRHPVDLAIFSLLAMTTGSIGIRLLPKNHMALLLVGIQVFLGVALIGLLGFVIGNRIRR